MRAPVSMALVIVAAAFMSPVAGPAHAETAAFRILDLNWKDPHWFVQLPLGCTDYTNFNAIGIKGFNPTIQEALQTDADGDGELDLNFLIVFDPLDPSANGGTLRFGASVACTAPLASSQCEALAAIPPYAYDNTPATCLSAVPGTTNAAYTPALVQPAAPCFVAALGDITVGLPPVPITLEDAYLAAEYSGNPASGLADGIIRGFLSESVANQTVIPEGSTGIDAIDGEPLSQLLRGGVNSCSQPAPATGDKDIGPGGVPGWYVYFNFTATVVPFSDPLTAVFPDVAMSLVLHAPAPNPFDATTTIRYTLPRHTLVEVSILDLAGRHVVTLATGEQEAGDHQVRWNGRDAHGEPVSASVYFVRLASDGEKQVRRIALLE